MEGTGLSPMLQPQPPLHSYMQHITPSSGLGYPAVIHLQFTNNKSLHSWLRNLG